MRSTQEVSVVFYFLVLIVALSLWTMVFGLPPRRLCSAPALAAIMKREAVSCLEFWANRYQTLIGASLTVAIAAVAAVPVYNQFRLLRTDQLRNSAAHSRALIQDLLKLEELMVAAQKPINSLAQAAPLALRVPGAAAQFNNQLRELTGRFRDFADLGKGGVVGYRCAEFAIDVLEKLEAALALSASGSSSNGQELRLACMHARPEMLELRDISRRERERLRAGILTASL